MITVKINGRVHDKAQVASISFDLGSNEIINGGIALLRDRLSQQLNITNRWADEQGALIGHVKAYIKWGEDEAIMLSPPEPEQRSRARFRQRHPTGGNRHNSHSVRDRA